MTPDYFNAYAPKDAAVDLCGNTAVFEVRASAIQKIVSDLVENRGLSFITMVATDEMAELGCFRIWYVFAVPNENAYIVPFVQLKNTDEFPSVGERLHGAWNDERRIHTFFGLTPVGHPDLRPAILQDNWPADIFPLRKDVAWDSRPGDAHGSYEFERVLGEGIYEIPVGPIHAGIIEPGHFRFSVAGEEIMLLEPRLGFTHKGSEKMFEILPLGEKLRLSEKISGDSSYSHSLAFCMAVEQLGGVMVPPRAQYLRVMYAELERLANHFGDCGAIMLDTGFNFGGANGARLREMILRINERITGSRFLRGVNAFGGVSKDITDMEQKNCSAELARIGKDFSEVIAVAETSGSLINRLKGTGVLSPDMARKHGVVGVAARAVGISRDARADHPYVAYAELDFGGAETESDGDVYARFRVRIKEAKASLALLDRALRALPAGPICADARDLTLKKNAFVASVVEGWRGEIAYAVATDSSGAISRVSPRDPSMVNWPALGDVGPGNVVPDFPLINKSFNLSYSGNDV